MRKWFIRILWGVLIFGVVLTIGIFWAIFDRRIGYMPDIEDLQNPIDRYASQVYSADGKLLGTWSLSRANRVMVDYSELDSTTVQALVATEDVRFYEHSGIDFKALGRAIVKRGILQQRNAGGGSTITQQLAKQLYSETAGSTLERLLQKPIEWVIALKLERNYTKEEIIALYLNLFDFLNNAVGIRTAAETYFSKMPKDLNVLESATLIGMCKNPSYFNPVRYPDRCLERRNVVLQQMVKAGFLDEEALDSLEDQPLGLKYHVSDHNDGAATYFRMFLQKYMTATEPERSQYKGAHADRDYYMDKLAWDEDPLYGWCNKNKKRDKYGNERPYNIYTDGLQIYTTLDSRMQEYAEQACRKHLVEDLQPVFDKENKTNPNAPYSCRVKADKAKKLLKQAILDSERGRLLKNAGVSYDDILKHFKQKMPMELYTHEGVRDTVMTPLDSLKYMKSLLRTGFISLDPKNGHVRTYVGGLDIRYFAFDMASKGRRQVGSTIKPLLYSLAMMPSGGNMTPCTEVPCEHRTYYTDGGQAWTPSNGSHAREGEMVPLRWGLQQSNNWVAAYLIDLLGPLNFKLLLEKFGIRNPEIQATLSLCLGPCDVSPAEMASAYTAFVNHGVRSAPMYVTKIEDSEGNVIATFKPRMNEVVNGETADKMIDMIKGVVDGGTGSRLRNRYGVRSELGGKTGTTNSNSDGWFIGVAPKLVSACWVGGDEPTIHFNTTANGQGANAALPIFAYFIKSVYADPTLDVKSTDKFDLPAGFSPCGDEIGGMVPIEGGLEAVGDGPDEEATYEEIE